MNQIRRLTAIAGIATALTLALSGLPSMVQATNHTTGHQVGKITVLAEICGYGSRAKQIRSKFSNLPNFNDGYKYWRHYWGKYDAVHARCGQVKDIADELIDLDVPADLGAGQQAFSKGDYAASFKEWLPLAEQGNAVAQANVGYLYHMGYGVPQDYAEALKWYLKAAEQDKTDAQFNLGNMYKNGEGIPADWVMALMWFSLAAEKGYEPAQENRDWLAARMTEADISRAERLAREWPEWRSAEAPSETECLSCEGTNEQATAPLPNFDGKWTFEIADTDNLSATDRQIVEIKDGKFRVEVSFNGWRGTIAVEIDNAGRLVGLGTVNGVGRESRNAPVNFTSRYHAGGFQEDVLSGNRLNQTFRIKLTRDELEASSEPNEQATPSAPNFDGEWTFEIRDTNNLSAMDRKVVEIQDNKFSVEVSVNGWRGRIRGEIDEYGRLFGQGNMSAKGWGRQNLPLDFVAEHRSGEFSKDVLIDFKMGDSTFRIKLTRHDRVEALSELE